MTVLRRWVLLFALGGSACVTPSTIMGHIDATTDADIADAIDELSEILSKRRRSTALRCHAARALGMLPRSNEIGVRTLQSVLTDSTEGPALRSWAAWALGEARSPASADALVLALRTSLSHETGYYVLEALAKHHVVLATRDEERLVEVVEAMADYAGNQSEALPSVYDVVSTRLKSMPVMVAVLDRARHALAGEPNPRRIAAAYNSAFELLEFVDVRRRQIETAETDWLHRLQSAAFSLRDTLSERERRLSALVVWYLGHLADNQAIAPAAASGLVGPSADAPGRATRSNYPPLRFLATWGLNRAKRHSAVAVTALDADVLARETDGRILRLLTRSSTTAGHDDVERILGRRARAD